MQIRRQLHGMFKAVSPGVPVSPSSKALDTIPPRNDVFSLLIVTVLIELVGWPDSCINRYRPTIVLDMHVLWTNRTTSDFPGNMTPRRDR
jgi:hypothetical protein